MERKTRKVSRSVMPFLMALTLIFLQSPFIIAQKASKRADTQTFAVAGDVHPATANAKMLGRASADQRIDKMIVVLKPHNEAELTQLLADQQDPKSPSYHQFLTPEQFGQKFGATESEIKQVSKWLLSNGLSIDDVQPGRLSLNVSGYVNQVEKAFGTTIGNYEYRGKQVISNTTEPRIPMALAGTVGGVIGLSGFHRYDYHHTPVTAVTSIKQVAGGKVGTNIAAGSGRILGPADFAKVYNVNPLYTAGLDGTGQTIAIVARCDFNLSDVRTFRTNTGLPAKDPVKVLPGANPGIFDTGEEGEVLLDTEWSGAVAKNATIKVVIGNSTSTTDGVDVSAQYIVNNNVAPVVSISFGACESAIGTSANTFYNNLFQQAAAQGQSVFVSSGDSGAAACTNSSGSPVGPAAVSGLCSTPYNVAVGGTGLNSVTFDASGNLTAFGSETVWNDGTGGGSTGGGVSSVYSKPSWQVCPGVPADGKRDLPDVSLMASPGKIGYYLYQGDSGGILAIGGTSASSPAMAGIMSLVVQKYGAQGNPNPKLYSLGNAQYTGGTAVYRDITSGNNSYAGVTGYTATTGFDRATGLGAPDANALVNNWNGTTGGGGGGTQTVTGSATPNLSIPDNNTTGITSTINIPTNLSIQSLSVTVSITHTYSGDIQIDLVSPSGTTVRLKSTSSTSTPNINATYAPTGFNGQASAGNWKLVVKDLAAADTGKLNSWSLSITGTPTTGTPTGDFSLTLTKTDGTSGSTAVWARGSTYARIVTVNRTGSFTGPVTLSYSVSRTGVFTNVTTSVNPVTGTTSQMNFSVSSTTSTSPATVTIIGTDGSGRQRTATISVTLQ